MLRRLEGMTFSKQQITIQVRQLTINNHPHTLDETVDNLESLSCGSSGFVMCETVQPLQNRFDVLLSENLLYKLDCDTLNKVTHQREQTHLIFLV